MKLSNLAVAGSLFSSLLLVRKEDLKIRTKVRVFHRLVACAFGHAVLYGKTDRSIDYQTHKRVHARRISSLQIVALKMLLAAQGITWLIFWLPALPVANYVPIPPLTDKQPI
jgi:hypothetical protein